MYTHRLLSYIGSYIAILGGVQAITFTAGVGENNPGLRAAVAQRLQFLGVTLDETANSTRSKEPRVISTADSAIAILVVPTNEELAMARETKAAIGA